jgi:hypothetical protein
MKRRETTIDALFLLTAGLVALTLTTLGWTSPVLAQNTTRAPTVTSPPQKGAAHDEAVVGYEIIAERHEPDLWTGES